MANIPVAGSAEYTYAFDDSGGIEPYLRSDKSFNEGGFGFLLIVAIGIRNDLLGLFRDDWRILQGEIQHQLNIDYLPPLHARLMFGQSRPETYRRRPNPYLGIAQEQTQKWYVMALDILHRYQAVKRGMSGLVAKYTRADSKARFVNSANDPISIRESSFIKFHTYGKKSKFHQKYLSSSTSALIEPILDCFAMIQEKMRQISGQAHVLLDPFSDADGLDDSVVFDFIKDRLSLERVVAATRVPDADAEPLLQAADLIAYGHFRSSLQVWRNQHDIPVVWEPLLEEVRRRGWPPRLSSADSGHIWRRKKNHPHMRRVIVAAQYAPAYHELHKFHPEFTERCLVTPQEFLDRVTTATASGFYIPILKDGLLAVWEAEKAKTAQSAAP